MFLRSASKVCCNSHICDHCLTNKNLSAASIGPTKPSMNTKSTNMSSADPKGGRWLACRCPHQRDGLCSWTSTPRSSWTESSKRFLGYEELGLYRLLLPPMRIHQQNGWRIALLLKRIHPNSQRNSRTFSPLLSKANPLSVKCEGTRRRKIQRPVQLPWRRMNFWMLRSKIVETTPLMWMISKTRPNAMISTLRTKCSFRVVWLWL